MRFRPLTRGGLPQDSDWLAQVREDLRHSSPAGAAAAAYLTDHRIPLGLHSQPTGARWTLGRRIQLHPRYAGGPADAPYVLGLIVHEVEHLRQGALNALSVHGELEAWQAQFSYIMDMTGRYHEDPVRNQIVRNLIELELCWSRGVLETARSLMSAYAGKGYRIDLLPLYPLPREILFRLLGRVPAEH